MATYHCSIKNGKTGNGKAHCDYILRVGSYANGTKKEELVYSQLGNLPSWAASPSDFFDRADLYERKTETFIQNSKLHCRMSCRWKKILN